jgi:hypothetical protein
VFSDIDAAVSVLDQPLADLPDDDLALLARILGYLRGTPAAPGLLRRLGVVADAYEQALARRWPAEAGDVLEVPGAGVLRRHGGGERTQWDRTALWATVRRRLLTEDADAAALLDRVATVYRLGGDAARLTALRAMGVDPNDYCTTTYGPHKVDVLPAPNGGPSDG